METVISLPLRAECPADDLMDMPNPDRGEADDLVIDESNFDQHFFDVRYHQPQDGQCLARFRARAEFVDGPLKRDVAHIIMYGPNGGEAAYKVMRKLAGASEQDATRVPIMMGTDLCNGMSVDMVCDKPYEYDCEFFFYTDPLNVPFDKRWEIIRLIGKQDVTMTSNVHEKIQELMLNTGSESALEEEYGHERHAGGVGELGGQVGCGPGEVGSRGGQPAPEGEAGGE